jgi:hypothetical protein
VWLQTFQRSTARNETESCVCIGEATNSPGRQYLDEVDAFTNIRLVRLAPDILMDVLQNRRCVTANYLYKQLGESTHTQRNEPRSSRDVDPNTISVVISAESSSSMLGNVESCNREHIASAGENMDR